MNRKEKFDILRRFNLRDGKPFFYNGFFFWEDNGYLYRNPNPKSKPSKRIGHIEDGEYIIDEEIIEKTRHNFYLSPGVKELMDKKAKSAGFTSSSAFLEYLIEASE